MKIVNVVQRETEREREKKNKKTEKKRERAVLSTFRSYEFKWPTLGQTEEECDVYI